MSKTHTLQEQFSSDKVTVTDHGNDYPIIHIKNSHAQASIALYGAQVMTYQPHQSDPVLWLSDSAVFNTNKAIRGGVPICWPWFGDHPSNADFPKHGFARVQTFDLLDIQQNKNDETELLFRLERNKTNTQYWETEFVLEATITVGESLTVSITMTHHGKASAPFSSGLHSYLQISNIHNVELLGLKQTPYYDNRQNDARCEQVGDITINEEVDRVYCPTTSDVLIQDPGYKRVLRISKTGSQATVVWNPWADKTKAMADFDDDGYLTMVCVEPANTREDTIHLDSGETHTLTTTISVEAL